MADVALVLENRVRGATSSWVRIPHPPLFKQDTAYRGRRATAKTDCPKGGRTCCSTARVAGNTNLS